MAVEKTIAASLGAMVTSLLTLGCCIPLPFLGAAGISGVSVFLGAARPWLLGISLVMLAAGFFQVYRGMKRQMRQSKIGLFLLGSSAVVIGLVFFFPQTVAGWLANISGPPKISAAQPPLSFLTTENFDQLRAAFNNAAGDVRVVLLLSPT